MVKTIKPRQGRKKWILQAKFLPLLPELLKMWMAKPIAGAMGYYRALLRS
jgi:hypothetical protein